jgi:hypothetical protein
MQAILDRAVDLDTCDTCGARPARPCVGISNNASKGKELLRHHKGRPHVDGPAPEPIDPTPLRPAPILDEPATVDATPDDDYWSEFGKCRVCFQRAGKACLSVNDHGKILARVHKGRERIEAPTGRASVIPITRTRARVETAPGHKRSITPETIGGLMTWRALCSCSWVGDRYTDSGTPEDEHARHLIAELSAQS